MKISKISKVIVLIASMVIMAVAMISRHLFEDGNMIQWSLVGSTIILVGAVAVAYCCSRSLVSVLIATMVTFGIYLSVMSLPYWMSLDSLLWILASMMNIVAAMILVIALNLKAGYNYNAIRIRVISATIAGIMIMLILGDLTNKNAPPDLSMIFGLFLPIALLCGSIAVISSDKSLGVSTTGNSMAMNVLSVEGFLLSIKDAYLLRNDADSLYQAIKKGEDASFIIQGFKRVYPELNLHEEDGKFVARIKLVRDGRTYVYAALPVMDVTDTGDSITMYGSAA